MKCFLITIATFLGVTAFHLIIIALIKIINP